MTITNNTIGTNIVTTDSKTKIILSCQEIAEYIANKINGYINIDAKVYNPLTGEFDIAQLNKLGAVFCTVMYKKELVPGKSGVLKKSRITKEPAPTGIYKTKKYQLILNIDWQKYINRRNENGDFIAAEKRSNGVENFGSRAVGIKDDNFYLNGVLIRNLESETFVNANGDILDNDFINDNFLPIKKDNNDYYQNKYGISQEKMPKYQTVRLDSLEYINIFGVSLIPQK